MVDPIPVQINRDGEQFIIVNAVCGPCGGTGIYTGMSEPPRVGNTCSSCGGSGSRTQSIALFTRIVKRDDIDVVRSRYRQESKVTYQEFLEGKRP